MSESSTPDSQHELDWLAFRYIAGELSDSERCQFESQLEGEQAAREAVARMVAQTQDISLALRERSVMPSIRQWRVPMRKAIVGIGSCAALLLAILLSHQVLTGSRHISSTAVSPLPASAELAYAWVQTRETDAANLEVDSMLFETPVASDDDDGPLATPHWMMAAVADLSGSSDQAPRVQE